MDDAAKQILNVLPEDGTKVSGGNVREQIDLKRSEFDSAKKWLKENGLVVLGRGRGGTISRVVGAEPPVEPKKLSKAERMEIAREEKQAQTREQKRRDSIRTAVQEKVEKEYPDADEIQVQVWDVDNGKCFVTIWNDKEGIVEERFA